VVFCCSLVSFVDLPMQLAISGRKAFSGLGPVLSSLSIKNKTPLLY
jgi:hypothetical protein